jgi:hypothetical protein
VNEVTGANKVYVTLRGEAEISSLVFKQRAVTWDSFGVGRANQSYLLYLPSYARNVTYTNVRRKGSGQLTTHETSLFNFDICGSDDNIVRTDK